MLCGKKIFHIISNYCSRNCPRKIRAISTELATALRPFYFVVHPDLFSKHPKQRIVNEESLKQLSAHIEILHERKYHILRESKTLRFYIRVKKSHSQDNLKLITLTLDSNIHDPKIIIQRLLELCNLSTDYVRNIKNTVQNNQKSFSIPDNKRNNDYQYGSKQFMDFDIKFREIRKQRSAPLLNDWLKSNSAIAKERINDYAPLKEDVDKLRKMLIQRFHLQDIQFDCGWNFEHFRGCLKTLERLAHLHQPHMENLRNRIVVFAPFTGISLENHVMLFTGDVLTNWIDFIKNINEHDAFVKMIPIYENTLSQVLRRIKIGRRKFMPKLQAKEYISHLRKVTTTLGDYLSYNQYPPNMPKCLNDYEIVVESESGPLMVNPSGQLIVPAACPGFMLIDFITSNLALAKERINKYTNEIYIERELTSQCIQQLRLQSLSKEDVITSSQMNKALIALLKQDYTLLENLNLHISNYYSVLTDGTLCIPWNFNNT